MKAADLEIADAETLSLIVQESEKRIAAQVQVMLATDARSNTLLSVASALAAAAFGTAAAQFPTQKFSPFVIGATVTAVFAFIAAVGAVIALWPRPLHIQGWSPRLFKSDLEKNKPLQTILAEMAVQNQGKIEDNHHCNAKIERRVRGAISAFALAPLAGAIAAGIRIFWPFCGS
jgi:hypothetical protein